MDSIVGPPSYGDVAPIASVYIKAASQRVVWVATGHIRRRRTPSMTLHSSTCLRDGHPTLGLNTESL